MSFNAEDLYRLLPETHRLRDFELGRARALELGLDPAAGPEHRPLFQWISLVATQSEVLTETLEQLHDNLFVETASSWALPYIGDLLGIRGLPRIDRLPLALRAEVGHTIGYRRRKGAVSALETLARDTTGWSARVVEFFQRISATQHFNHVRRHNVAVLNLRNGRLRHFDDSPFEASARRHPTVLARDSDRIAEATRTVEVRRIQTRGGRWNIPNIGIFLWRLKAHRFTASPMVPALIWAPGPGALQPSQRHWLFHPLGRDTQLFGLPITRPRFGPPAQPQHVDLALNPRIIQGAQWTAGGAAPPVPPAIGQFHPSQLWYPRSVQLGDGTVAAGAIAATGVLVADLADIVVGGNVIGWAHQDFSANNNIILLDPRRGRALWPAAPPAQPHATFHLGFSAEMGGGEYGRSATFRTPGVRVTVSNQAPAAFNTIANGIAGLGAQAGHVEILNSGRYAETPAIDVIGRELEVRAADGARPVLQLGGDLVIRGDAGGTAILNGLLITGGRIRVAALPGGGMLNQLIIRHCTIVPALNAAGEINGALPALVIDIANCRVQIENSICAPLRLQRYCRAQIKNSIIDAGSSGALAISDIAAAASAGFWTIENCSIRGRIQAEEITLASNTIFAAQAPLGQPPVYVRRRQEGCVRFSWVPPGSVTPRRHQCLPEEDRSAPIPVFTSTRLAHAGYMQLNPHGSTAIFSAADDSSEIGAFHDVFAPQREAHLRARLDEHLRLGLEAGLFHCT